MTDTTHADRNAALAKAQAIHRQRKADLDTYYASPAYAARAPHHGKKADAEEMRLRDWLCIAEMHLLDAQRRQASIEVGDSVVGREA